MTVLNGPLARLNKALGGLLFLVSLAQAQPAPLPTQSNSIPFEDDFRTTNNSKAIRELQKGRYRQTGVPTFVGGFCFRDGTCMSTTSTVTIAGSTTPLNSFVLKTGDTMTGALTVTGTSVTANAYFGDGSHLSGIGAGGDGAVQFIKGGNIFGRTDKIHFNEVTGTFGFGTAVGTTRGIRISTNIIGEIEVCSQTGTPTCGGFFTASSGANPHTTFTADGALRWNSAAVNRGGFSTGGALYIGTDPIAAGGVGGDVYISGNLTGTAYIGTTGSFTGVVTASTITSSGGFVPPQFSLVALRAMAPSAIRLTVMGPSPTYDNYVATGTGVGQWINQRTQVGP